MVEGTNDGNEERSLAPALWLAWVMLAAVGLVDIFRGEVPIDFEYYWNVAEALRGAEPPYAPENFPLVYLPGILYVFKPLGLLTQSAAGALFVVLLWGAAALGCLTFARRFALPHPPAVIAAGCLLFFPLYRGLEPLNLSMLLFGMLAWFAPHDDDKPVWIDFLVAFAFGYLIAMKPHWLAVAGAVAVCQRRWGAAFGAGAGGLALLGLSVIHEELWESFFQQLAWHLDYIHRLDVWVVHPAVGAAALAAWLGVLGWLWVRGFRDAWVFPMTAVLIWPRMQHYDFVLMLPVLMYVAQHARRASLATLVAFSLPVGVLATLAVTDGEVGFEVGHTWRTTVLSALYLFSSLVLAGFAVAAIKASPVAYSVVGRRPSGDELDALP